MEQLMVMRSFSVFGLVFSMTFVGVVCVHAAYAGPPMKKAIQDAGVDRDSAVNAASKESVSTDLPDPQALSSREQWLVELRYSAGDVFLVRTDRVVLAAPRTTPRAFGRFALELYEGRALLERVRFDFPLLGAPPLDGGMDVGKKLESAIGVYFPEVTKGTRFELYDRATRKRYPLKWPLVASVGDAADAGR